MGDKTTSITMKTRPSLPPLYSQRIKNGKVIGCHPYGNGKGMGSVTGRSCVSCDRVITLTWKCLVTFLITSLAAGVVIIHTS